MLKNSQCVYSSKLCRLCASKDGPFLNIFGPGVDLVKKIEEILLFKINEWDDLPHKICYRCSAKVVDYHEFHQKCIQTQEHLAKQSGIEFKREKSRNIKSVWEAKLNKNNISNDKYCEELVQKALESIASLPTTSVSHSAILYKEVKIKLQHVDRVGFPGVVKKDGKYFISKPTKPSWITRDGDKVNKTYQQTKAEKKFAHEKQKEDNLKQPPLKADALLNDNQVEGKVFNNFTSVKVGGVGIVFTCKYCDHLLLDKSGISSHKCKRSNRLAEASLRGIQLVPNGDGDSQEPNSSSAEDQDPNTTNNQSAAAVTQRKRKSECIQSYIDEQRSLPKKNNLQLNIDKQNSLSKKNNPQLNNCSLDVSGPPVPAKNNETVSQDLSEKSTLTITENDINSSNDTRFYLVPMGNNSFSLQKRPQTTVMLVSNAITANIPVITSTPSTPPVTSVPSNSSHNTSGQFPTNGKTKIRILKSLKSVVPVKMHPDSSQCNSNEHSILPDSNKFISPPRQKIVKLQPLKKTISNKPDTNTTANPIKKIPTLRKHQKPSSTNSLLKPEPPSAPYPVGLLCRNTNNVPSSNIPTGSDNTSGISKSATSKNEYPQYTILPPKEPGKIVITTVPPGTNSLNKKKPRKLKYDVSSSTNEEDLTSESQQVQEENHHFFTYVNLDPMFHRSQTASSFTTPVINVSTVTADISTVSGKSGDSSDRSESRGINRSNEKPRKKIKILPIPEPPKINKTVTTKPETPLVEETKEKYICQICDLEFSREKKLKTHVKSHYEGFYDED